MRCFLDKQNIKSGTNWQEAFLDGLEHTCLFVPLVSEAAIATIKEVKASDEKNDNVLLEFEHAAR